MKNSFYLAVRFVAAHRLRTCLLVTSIGLTLFLLVVHHVLIARFEESLTARAESTPAIVGARGSRLDLVLHALYFESDPPGPTSMREVARIKDGKKATPIPLMTRYTASGFRIVGTTGDYWKLRNLLIERGHRLERLGDCAVGSEVASALDLKPGDQLVSDPPGGLVPDESFPLALRVRGVLKQTGTPDDRAVFTSLETTWVIAGLGHGHESIVDFDSETGISREDAEHKLIVQGQLQQFTEVTDDNARSFHFHGDRNGYPVTSIIAVAPDEKSETILIGRYLGRDDAQIVLPEEAVRRLLRIVLRVRRLIDAASVVVGVVTVLFLALTILLSLQLRQREMETMFKLGCSRFVMVKLQLAELVIVGVLSLSLTGVLLGAAFPLAPVLLRSLMNQAEDAGDDQVANVSSSSASTGGSSCSELSVSRRAMRSSSV